MNTFFSFKCRPWIFAAGILAFLTVGFFAACSGGGGPINASTVTASMLFSDVTICAFIVLFWVGLFRLCNPVREPDLTREFETVVKAKRAFGDAGQPQQEEKPLCTLPS